MALALTTAVVVVHVGLDVPLGVMLIALAMPVVLLLPLVVVVLALPLNVIMLQCVLLFAVPRALMSEMFRGANDRKGSQKRRQRRKSLV
jgi:hypothetical protein